MALKLLVCGGQVLIIADGIQQMFRGFEEAQVRSRISEICF